MPTEFKIENNIKNIVGLEAPGFFLSSVGAKHRELKPTTFQTDFIKLKQKWVSKLSSLTMLHPTEVNHNTSGSTVSSLQLPTSCNLLMALENFTPATGNEYLLN